MKKLLSTVLAVIVSQAVYAAPSNTPEKSLTAQDQRLIALAKELCLSPDKEGGRWKVDAGAKLGAKAPARIVKLEGGVNVEFTKEQWSGVQRILPGQQKDDNKRYSDCTTSLLPVLKPIVYPPSSVIKHNKHVATIANPAQSSKPSSQNPSIDTGGKNTITTGTITNSKVINQGEVKGNVTIDMSH
jgi:hypothetical protein